jgi:hypothetical protein
LLLLLRLLQAAALPQLHLVLRALLWLLRRQYPARPVEKRLPLLLGSTRLCCCLLLT